MNDILYIHLYFVFTLGMSTPALMGAMHGAISETSLGHGCALLRDLWEVYTHTYWTCVHLHVSTCCHTQTAAVTSPLATCTLLRRAACVLSITLAGR